MPWHPPIPFGAFYSEDAIKLGPALALLGYCYDKVDQQTSMLRLNLHTAAGDMSVPYPTIKRWWELLRRTCYITAYKERGRAGMDVQMSDDWLDWWREDRETGSKAISNSRETGQKRDRNGTETASEMIPNNSAYKVPMISDQAGGGKDQDRTAHSPPHPAVLAYRTAFSHIRLTQKQEAIISALVGERVEHLECWREVIQDYELSTIWKPENIGNMRSRFEKKLKERESQKDNRNGQRPVENRPALQPFISPISADVNSPAESTKKLVEMMRKQKP